jgi:hypothetical protein
MKTVPSTDPHLRMTEPVVPRTDGREECLILGTLWCYIDENYV